jgi:hypothetical protein
MLDIACGTGVVTHLAAERIATGRVGPALPKPELTAGLAFMR